MFESNCFAFMRCRRRLPLYILDDTPSHFSECLRAFLDLPLVRFMALGVIFKAQLHAAKG